MKIRHSYSTALTALLVLGLLLPWDAFSKDIGSFENSANSFSELEECFEEVVEEHGLDLQSTSAFCLSSILTKSTCILYFCDVPGSATLASTAHLPSGWMMPLRI